MSDQRHDAGSLTLTEEDLGVDPPESPEPASVRADVPESSEGAERASAKKVRRTVRIPDDDVARPSQAPPAVAQVPPAAGSAPSVTQPILGQRIIAIGGPVVAKPASVPPAAPRPASVPPAAPVEASAVRPPSVPPRPVSVPPRPVSVPPRPRVASVVEQEPVSELQPNTEPSVPSNPAPVVPRAAQPAQEDDSWTPYQPRVASEPPPAPARLVSPLVSAPAAPVPAAPAAGALPPVTPRRPSVQFEAPPAWARPPGMRAPADSHPGADAPLASAPATTGPVVPPTPINAMTPSRPPSRPSYGSSPGIATSAAGVIDLATPPPGQPWGPPRDSIVDVAVDFESDITVIDVMAASAPVAEPVATDKLPIHSRPTRLDEQELHAPLPRGYDAEPSDLSSSHLEVVDPSGELDAGPPSIEEVEIEPDSDSRPAADVLATDDDLLTELADSEPPPQHPPPAPKAPEKGAPPAPKPAASLGLGNLAPLPLTDAASQRKKGKPWWEDLFNDDFVRTGAKGVKEDYKSEVDFIEDSLGMEKGATILDLACGTGRHAIELSKRGYRMVGFDLSLAMLARAADLAQAEDQRINFVQGDMREMQFEEAFDGVYSWNTSFGYFEEDKNAQVAGLVHRALRKGGQFLLDIVNRDYIIQESPTTAWFEGDGCICMDEMHIDWITSRMRVKRTIMFDDGRSRELEYSVRLYSLHELGRLLHEQGFRVTEVSGLLSTPGVFFGCQSPRTMILAEKR